MHIDRIVGRSLLDALQRARAAHGEAAVVLSQEVLQGGDVALAVDVRQAPTAVAKPRLDPLREACGPFSSFTRPLSIESCTWPTTRRAPSFSVKASR